MAEMTLPEELLERARTYEQGGPSAEHTADLLRRAALRIDRLNSTSSPLDLVEANDAEVLIKALLSFRPMTIEEENCVLYYVRQLQKVAGDNEESLDPIKIDRAPLEYWKNSNER